jgi:hypothetical protein
LRVKQPIGHAGDDAERSDEEKRRIGPAGDDAERSDEEKRRIGPARGAFGRTKPGHPAALSHNGHAATI